MTEKTDNECDDIFDDLLYKSIYPDISNLFQTGPISLDQIINNCIIVLDTNVLLLPYTSEKKSLTEIRKLLQKLVNDNKLIIPGQVAREFVKNRATKLTELYSQFKRKKDNTALLQQVNYPLLESLEDYVNAQELAKQIDKQILEYKAYLDKILDHIRNWIWNDPVSLMYSSLFSEKNILDIDFDAKTLKEELLKLKKFKVPPGYKDSNKDSNGAGDLIIWKTILKIAESKKENLIFVTGDVKSDWWYKSENQALYPRYELFDEYKRISSGKIFHMMQFSTLLELKGVSSEIVEEIKEKEVIQLKTKSKYNFYLLRARNTLFEKIKITGSIFNIKSKGVSIESIITKLRRIGVLSEFQELELINIINQLNLHMQGEYFENEVVLELISNFEKYIELFSIIMNERRTKFRHFPTN